MSERAVEESIWDRAVRQLSGAWQDISEVARVRVAGKVRPALPDDDLERLRERVAACIAAQGGESLARARAADVGRTYMGLDGAGRQRFLAMLARDFDIDLAEVEAEAQALLKSGDVEAKRALAGSLRDVTEAPRLHLFKQFNGLPEGLKFLVDMRADALSLARQEPLLQRIDDDLRRLLSDWFDVGFLSLQRLDWNSPAVLLEKLIAYEAVHAISSWDDLKNRLESDRRMFGFFHPNMTGEPLIFVEVALVQGIASSVQKLLDPGAPVLHAEDADTAIFYSISNTQKGLAGVSLGDFLIKRVVTELARELPRLKTFATLSPMPGFRRWLEQALQGDDPVIDAEPGSQARAELIAAVAAKDADELERWRDGLTALGARYLVKEKRGDRPLDPVARFHLANGARVERLNWMGDRSPKGMAESCGLMVNYLYRPDDIAANHESFVTQGRVATSGEVRSQLRRSRSGER
jgi:malonyl-CoA decarboxylase